jgi:DNA-binding MarR family transcriptional regulator
LNQEEMAAWAAYVSTHVDLQAHLGADLAPHGLTLGDYEVLVHLSESGDRQMRMCDLARRLRLSPSGLTRRLDGLVRNGLVRREASEHDRRVMLATLTPRGLTVMTKAAPDHLSSVRRYFFDHLSDDDVRALAEILGRVRNALEAQCPGE